MVEGLMNFTTFNSLGKISMSRRAISKVASVAVIDCYGVVGLVNPLFNRESKSHGYKGVVLSSNETDIIIKKAYENCRENPKDKYNPVFYLLIDDFEIVERQEQIEAKAYDEFRDNLNDIEINEDDLGF